MSVSSSAKPNGNEGTFSIFPCIITLLHWTQDTHAYQSMSLSSKRSNFGTSSFIRTERCSRQFQSQLVFWLWVLIHHLHLVKMWARPTSEFGQTVWIILCQKCEIDKSSRGGWPWWRVLVFLVTLSDHPDLVSPELQRHLWPHRCPADLEYP